MIANDTSAEVYLVPSAARCGYCRRSMLSANTNDTGATVCRCREAAAEDAAMRRAVEVAGRIARKRADDLRRQRRRLEGKRA